MPYVYVHPTEDETSWFCELWSERCVFVSRGRRCARQVHVGIDVCWQHARAPGETGPYAPPNPAAGQGYNVRLGESTIPRAGRGVFAVRFIPRGHIVCRYTGEWISLREMRGRYPNGTLAPYVEEVQRDTGVAHIDSACVRGIGAMLNGVAYSGENVLMSDGKWQRPNAQNAHVPAHRRYRGNTEAHMLDGLLVIRATRDIAAGDELLLLYGADYFKVPMIHGRTLRVSPSDWRAGKPRGVRRRVDRTPRRGVRTSASA